MRARENPFRSDRLLSLRYRLQEGSWADLLARFESLGRRAALVGPQGTGKTTLLEDLAPRFRDAGYRVRELRLDDETRGYDPAVLESLTPRDLILFDGAEQLGRFAWSSFERRSRAAGGLLVTVHRPGRLPTLLETRTSPELLAGLVDQILGPSAVELHSLTPVLFEKHGGISGRRFGELYDRMAINQPG